MNRIRWNLVLSASAYGFGLVLLISYLLTSYFLAR
jgi:hypothetical protein